MRAAEARKPANVPVTQKNHRTRPAPSRSALWPADAPISGLVVTRYDHVPPAYRSAPGRIEVVEAAHPVPDAAGLQAAQRIAALVQGLTANDLVLIAPVAGVVSSRNVEPGEVMAAGQSAITVAQPSRPWARIYVSQFVLPTLHPGDSLSARLDGDSTVFRGRISAIATRADCHVRSSKPARSQPGCSRRAS